MYIEYLFIVNKVAIMENPLRGRTDGRTDGEDIRKISAIRLAGSEELPCTALWTVLYLNSKYCY